jgi:hypothetical protein
LADDDSPAVEAEETAVEEVEETEAETTPAEESPPNEKDASPEPEEKPEPAPRYKLKVRNEERELSHEEVQELVNRGDYFNRARQEMEAARWTKSQFLTKPIDTLIELLHGQLGSREAAIAKAKEIFLGWYGPELEYEHAAPEKKEEIELRRKLATLEEEKASREAHERSAREQASWANFVETVEKGFQAEGISLDDESIADLDAVWNAAIDLEEDISTAEAVRRVKVRQERRLERASQRLAQNPEELGKRAPDLVQKLREKDIAQVKAAKQRPRPSAGTSEPAPRQSRKAPSVMSPSQMLQELSKL